eukprot:412941-Amphidinium_carterae.1
MYIGHKERAQQRTVEQIVGVHCFGLLAINYVQADAMVNHLEGCGHQAVQRPAAFLGSLRIHSCRDHCDDLDVEVRIADGVDLNFVKSRGLDLRNVKVMSVFMEADLPRASVQAQVVPQSGLDANKFE